MNFKAHKWTSIKQGTLEYVGQNYFPRLALPRRLLCFTAVWICRRKKNSYWLNNSQLTTPSWVWFSFFSEATTNEKSFFYDSGKVSNGTQSQKGQTSVFLITNTHKIHLEHPDKLQKFYLWMKSCLSSVQPYITHYYTVFPPNVNNEQFVCPNIIYEHWKLAYSQKPCLHKHTWPIKLLQTLSLYHFSAVNTNTSKLWRHIKRFVDKDQILALLVELGIFLIVLRVILWYELWPTFSFNTCEYIAWKSLILCFSDSYHHLPPCSYSWAAPRLHLSVWSVCIPAQLYLKASSLHWLKECTSARETPIPRSLVYLSLSTTQYLFLIMYGAHWLVLLLCWTYICAN